MSRKKGGSELIIIEDSVDTSIKRFKDYIKKSEEKLFTAASNSIRKIRLDTKQQKLENINEKKNN